MEGKKKHIIHGENIFLYDELDKKILEGLREGMTGQEIAKQNFRSHRNIQNRIKAMCDQAKVGKSISLVIFAIRNKVIDL